NGKTILPRPGGNDKYFWRERMKNMHSTKWVPLVAYACFMSVAGDVGAAVSLSLHDSHELGFVDPGLPAGDPFVAPYVNQLIGMGLSTSTVIGGTTFLRSGNVFSPLDPAVLGPRTTYGEITATTVSIALGSGYEYLMAKYDGPNYGTEVWYVGDLSGTI